jgi:hypothetical protein
LVSDKFSIKIMGSKPVFGSSLNCLTHFRSKNFCSHKASARFRVSLLEEYKDNINVFSKQIEDKKSVIQQLEQTKKANESLTQDEQKTLEKRLFNLKQKLENEREKLKNIDMILSTKAPKSAEEPNQNDSASKLSAYEAAFDRNSNLMSKSFNENMFFNRNKIEVSHFDFNLDLNGDAKEEEKVLNNVVDADSRTSTIKRLARNVSTETDVSSNASPLMMPKYHSLSSIDAPQDEMVPFPKVLKSNGAGPSTGVVQRQIPKHKRPLTRYLPNFSLDFNLKRHIETAGHQIQLCPHVLIDGKCLPLINLTFALIDIFLFSSFARSNKLSRIFEQSRREAALLEPAGQQSLVRVRPRTPNAGVLLG